MLRLTCPWCGPRDEPEFRCGGEGGITRPDPVTASDAEWGDYLHARRNPRGVLHERWLHRHGCGRWFMVARDTATHEVLAAWRIGEAPPR
jgi:sarcosine oxidase subunit delta